MKVKIGDLTPNPFRNMEHYPIDKAKVEALAASINQTGFWDNILARKVNGKVQIAYGHHRLAALRKAQGLDEIVDIPVKDLDDATMLKIMANENMDEWNMRPGVIEETVQATKKFLDEHPEEREKIGGQSPKREASVIAEFLGWPWTRVKDALARLSDYKDGAIAKEAAHMMPHQAAESHFARTIKSISKTTKVSPEVQVRAAKRIVEQGDMSEVGIRATVVNEVYPTREKKEKDSPILNLRKEIIETELMFRELGRKIINLERWKDKIRECDYRNEIGALSVAANSFLEKYKNFIGGSNGK